MALAPCVCVCVERMLLPLTAVLWPDVDGHADVDELVVCHPVDGVAEPRAVPAQEAGGAADAVVPVVLLLHALASLGKWFWQMLVCKSGP